MKAILVNDTLSQTRVGDIAKPTPEPDEIRMKIKACGLNFGDLLMLNGTYQERPDLPFVLGMEPAGIVDAIGKDVSEFKVGDRCVTYSGHGGLAEFGCFKADQCLAIPSGMDMNTAAGFLIAYGTSHLALDHRARLLPKETLLVLGAAGGIGLTAVEIGKQMGATVIACARGAGKLEIAAQAGADHLIDSDTDDLRKIVKSLGGADVVYDPVGGDLFKEAFRACNPEARIIPLGFASGSVPQIPANILLVKNITAIGYYWGGYTKFRPKKLRDSLETMLKWHEQGRIKPHISHIFPIEETNTALELLKTRKSTGKVVVTL